MARESLEILRAWYQSIVQGRKENTYKLALGLSILECARRAHKKGQTGAIVLSYSEITDQWVEFYWDHTSVFKLRQSVNSEKPPVILQILRKYMDDTHTWGKYWKKVDKSMRSEIQGRVLRRSGFIDNPISRLPVDHQTVHPTGDPQGDSQFYSWDKGKQEITITPEFSELIETQYPILADIVLLTWAEFLEKYNTTPGLIQKIRLENPTRSLEKIRKLFFEYPEAFQVGECFYCQSSLEIMTLDHIVPFSFIFSDDVFNLVPCCKSCNSSKSDRVPTEEFIQKANLRNQAAVRLNIEKSGLPEDPEYVKNNLNSLVNLCKAAGFQEWSIK